LIDHRAQSAGNKKDVFRAHPRARCTERVARVGASKCASGWWRGSAKWHRAGWGWKGAILDEGFSRRRPEDFSRCDPVIREQRARSATGEGRAGGGHGRELGERDHRDRRARRSAVAAEDAVVLDSLI